MTLQEPRKPLSERKEGYFIAFLFGSLWVPFGWIASPLVLLILNKTMKKKDEKQPNKFLVWSVIGVVSLPIQLSQLEKSSNFLGGMTDTTSNLNNNLQDLSTYGSPKPDFYMSDYEKIEDGMTYQEIVAILGKEGEERSSGSYFKIYSCNDGTGSGANMTASFKDGILTSKSQIGLK